MIGLHPEALRAAVYEAIKPYYDPDLAKKVAEIKGQWYGERTKELNAHAGYQAGVVQIKAAHEAADKAAAKLHEQ